MRKKVLLSYHVKTEGVCLPLWQAEKITCGTAKNDCRYLESTLFDP